MSKARQTRKISQAMEGIVVRLTPSELEDTKSAAMELLQQKQALEYAKKSAASEFKAKIQEVDRKIQIAMTEVASGKRELEVIVEEYLTPTNEVIKIRADNGEPIGKPRTATAAELQESPSVEDNGFQ